MLRHKTFSVVGRIRKAGSSLACSPDQIDIQDARKVEDPTVARLGIVIGVSENVIPLASLAACANDATAIAAVLKETGRFDDVLVLIGKSETGSRAVKDSIATFIDRYKGTSVDELIFYFSGHGDFSGDEFTIF